MKTEKTGQPWVPRALQEVWEWKDAISREVDHLPPREALHQILVRSTEVARKYGYDLGLPTSGKQVAAVAERRSEYGVEGSDSSPRQRQEKGHDRQGVDKKTRCV